jgi:metal-responsive CopG/Arc/MetJ family transcriptional regulator
MKTAISLSDKLFREAETFARRTGKSRSQLYAEALAEYVARHSSDEITNAMNDACKRLGQPDKLFVRSAARRTLKKETW